MRNVRLGPDEQLGPVMEKTECSHCREGSNEALEAVEQEC